MAGDKFRKLNVGSMATIAASASANSVANAGMVILVDPDDCYSEDNPRKTFNQELIEQWAHEFIHDSVGQREPIWVAPRNQDGKYAILHGESRLRAALIAKKENPAFKLKALVDEGFSRRSMSQIYYEKGKNNIARDNMSLLDTAAWMKKSIHLAELEGEKLTQSQLAKSLGKTNAWVSRVIELAEMPNYLRDVYINEITTDPWTLSYLVKIDKKDPELCKQFVKTGVITRHSAKWVLDNLRLPEAGTTSGSNEQATGTTSGSNEQATGTTPGSNEQATGTTPGSNEQTTGTTPGSNEQTTGTTPGSNEQATGTTPGSNEQATGTTPGSNEQATGTGTTSGSNEQATGTGTTSGSNEQATGTGTTSGSNEQATGTGTTSGSNEQATGTIRYDVVHAQQKEVVLLKNGAAYIYWMQIKSGQWISAAETTFEHGINEEAILSNEDVYESEAAAQIAALERLDRLVGLIDSNADSLDKDELKTAEFLRIAVDLDLDRLRTVKTQKRKLYIVGDAQGKKLVVLLKQPSKEGFLCVADPADMKSVNEVLASEFKPTGYISLDY
ncbi:KorB domain-containing protein [Dickeya sp. NCPPB 3274]|uniref:KorB domain-containing protein n=1 Tax=Dickeya sp. NCPPB 3274 TaxID=568766 RepID=UPI0003A7E18D|nr:KorB domain-containing protein [Dickeya sp. NCPPB 3274]